MSIAPVSGFNTAKWIVSATAGQGTHTTIAAALTAASSGDTIFIRPGTYTENPTLKAGVNLTAFGSDSSLNATGDVIISGTCTLTTAGSVTISGIQLQTNSAALLAVTGTLASVVNLNNCFLNCTNNTGITFSSSSASSAINITNCTGNLGTTGIAYWTITASGVMTVMSSTLLNTGLSTTASTTSTLGHIITHSALRFAMSTSSTGAYTFVLCQMDSSPINTTILTTAGTGQSFINLSNLGTGTASCVSIGTGTTVVITHCSLTCSNTNAVTGAGTAKYGLIDFPGSSQTINATTQTQVNGGTFTPAIAFGGSSTGITYSTQSANYTRIANVVFVIINIILTSKGSQTGTMTFTGLPFTVAGNSPRAVTECTSITFAGNYVESLFLSGTTTGEMVSVTTASGVSLLSNTAFSNTSAFVISGFYLCSA